VYESRRHPPLARRHFLRRLAWHAAVSAGVVLVSLLIGMAGYGYFEHLDWRSAFLNTAMLLGGMGPVDDPRTDGGKLFAGLFALYAGLVFLFAAGMLVAPFLHRLMHKFHWSDRELS
jgi:hypothetical protein